MSEVIRIAPIESAMSAKFLAAFGLFYAHDTMIEYDANHVLLFMELYHFALATCNNSGQLGTIRLIYESTKIPKATFATTIAALRRGGLLSLRDPETHKLHKKIPKWDCPVLIYVGIRSEVSRVEELIDMAGMN